MKYLIIVLLLAFLAYALYYFIFRKKGTAARKDSGLSQETGSVKTQSQLVKKEEKEASDLRDKVEEKTEAAPAQSSLLREDLAEEVAKSRTDRAVFDDVKHGLQDSAEDMLIKPELFDEDLAKKAAAVKAETDVLTDQAEDKITLQFGNTLMQSELAKEEKVEEVKESETPIEEKVEDLEAQSSLLREDLAEKILEERQDLAARIDEQKAEETPAEVKDTILDLSNSTEAELDNKSFDAFQHFQEAQAQTELMKDDIDEVAKEKVIVKKYVRKERE